MQARCIDLPPSGKEKSFALFLVLFHVACLLILTTTSNEVLLPTLYDEETEIQEVKQIN